MNLELVGESDVPDVFLGHLPADLGLAVRLAVLLQEHGYSTCVEHRAASAATDRRFRIAKCVVMVWTHAARESADMRARIDSAVQPVVAVIVDSAPPPANRLIATHPRTTDWLLHWSSGSDVGPDYLLRFVEESCSITDDGKKPRRFHGGTR